MGAPKRRQRRKPAPQGARSGLLKRLCAETGCLSGLAHELLCRWLDDASLVWTPEGMDLALADPEVPQAARVTQTLRRLPGQATDALDSLLDAGLLHATPYGAAAGGPQRAHADPGWVRPSVRRRLQRLVAQHVAPRSGGARHLELAPQELGGRVS